MIFAILLMDRPGTGELRIQVRPEHRAYLAQLSDRMAFAGPLISDDGKTPIGSLLAIDFASRADVEAWLKKPQFRVGAECWSKEFWNKFPPLVNISGEDQVLAFRAIILGAGSTLHHPTVRHRIGGISMTKINTVDEKINKLNN